MRRTLLVTAVLAACLGVARGQDNQAKADQALLKGRWVVTACEENGKVLPKAEWAHSAWTIDGNTATVTVKGMGGLSDANERFKLTTDSGKSPAHLTLQADNPRFGFTCIYKVQRDKLDGDVMTICWNAGGQTTRPTEFKTTRADTFTMLTLRRNP